MRQDDISPRVRAEMLWGPDPEKWPPWTCATCEQQHSGWALECGRCESHRFIEEAAPEPFFKSEEWPVWRDKIVKHLAAAWFLNYDLRRLPPVLRKVRDGERLTVGEASRLVSSATGLMYFASMAVGRGLRAGRDADVLEGLYRERLRRTKVEKDKAREEER